ncbi:hypothetical protein QTO34_020223 [Cnephaeus nilssonii]|uniref:Uncharacterized protein n=1 Tax=Cnephaeus nilssonii TaxID=3371016 RepID=A0AA40LNI3_CNENI|nr:hypothetical protein QTO34_020223 [Eptesicus nilssonii]
MPKRGCPFGVAAPLQLKVRVGWKELGRGVCSERYSREIYGECGVGLPPCDAGLGRAVPTGRAPGRPGASEGAGDRSWSFERDGNAPTPTCGGHSSHDASLPPHTSGLCAVPPPGSVLRGCRPRALAGLPGTGAPRAQREVREGDVLGALSSQKSRSHGEVFEERALPARPCGCARRRLRERGPRGEPQGEGRGPGRR